MMDYIPEKEPKENSRANVPFINEKGLPGCFYPGDFGEKPQKPQKPLIATVQENTQVIAECCAMARNISTFLMCRSDENMNVNKSDAQCLIDEIECQRIDLRTLQTILMQIMNELGA